MKRSLLLAALVAVAIASNYVPILHRADVPANSGWSILRRADPNQKVTFHIALQQQNLDILDQKFEQISDPTSKHYAKYMTRKEVAELTAAPRKVQKEVMKWIFNTEKHLPKGHLFEVDNQLDAIKVVATCAFVEKLFQTEMNLFVNERNGGVVAKHLGDLNIPEHLVNDIVLVTGITELIPVKDGDVIQKQPAKRQAQDNQCNTPYNLKNLYNIPQDLAVTEKGANAGIYADTSAGSQEGFGLGSIEDFQNALGLPKDPITCILGTGKNMYVTNDTDTEANLDTEMITGMAPGVQACFYIMEWGNGWMYEFARELISADNTPLVISMSYGWNEVDSCNNLTAGYTFVGNCTAYHIPSSQQYVSMTNTLFQKLGVLGHTLLAASGDGGTAGTHGSLNNCETMGPIFPAASPYVLTVGATSIEPSTSVDQTEQNTGAQPPICTNTFYQCECTTSTNEQACVSNGTGGFDTGGGFSVYTAMPAYQTKAVTAYLKSGVTLPPAMYFNKANRGFPDVAAVGENICLLDPNTPCDPEGGTSASTPIWAGMITLLNNDRLKAGKTPLGFFNKVIYTMFDADSNKYFNNKFAWGNNPGGCPTNMGFNAKAGYWTPLTGCGSPKFDQIRAYVATLP